MKNVMIILAWIIFLLAAGSALAQNSVRKVPDNIMQKVYEEVKTPYKYGLVMVPEDNSKKADCPSVFREGNSWYMTYLLFNGRGYETWLAKSDDLLNWQTSGKLLSFSDTTGWDSNQKAGYIALQDYNW